MVGQQAPTFAAALLLLGVPPPGTVLATAEGAPKPLDPTRFFSTSSGDEGAGEDDGTEDAANSLFRAWYDARGRDLYPNAAFLPVPPSASVEGGGGGINYADGAAIMWSVDEPSGSIRIAVAARSSGWVGFGLAEAGGMLGSDVVLFSADEGDGDDSSSVELGRSSPAPSGALVDAHVRGGYAAPEVDARQDWMLIHSEVAAAVDGKEGVPFLLFEAERFLDTGDNFDRPILLDAPYQRVIAAWGDGSATVPVYHSPDHRVKGSLRFRGGDADADGNGIADGMYGDIFHKTMAEEAEYVDIVHDGMYVIPSDDTTYEYLCFGLSDLVVRGVPTDKPLHIIGMEAIIDSPKHLHHLVGMGITGKEELGPGERCRKQYGDPIFGWAPGTTPLQFPPEAGLPFGPSIDGGFTMFSIQFHFDNRWGDEGVTDVSGVRLYYTSKLRPHDAAVLSVGDPLVFLGGEPVGTGLSRHTFDCPSSCTGSLFADEDVTVFREALHMHETGERMVNEQIRDGEVVRAGKVDYWDFYQSGLYEVPQGEFKLRKGDAFRTTCYFVDPTSDGDSTVKFGLRSQDEMCLAYLLYYPKQSGVLLGICGYDWLIPACRSDEYVFEEGLLDAGREFGFSRPAESGLDAGAVVDGDEPGEQEEDTAALEKVTEGDKDSENQTEGTDTDRDVPAGPTLDRPTESELAESPLTDKSTETLPAAEALPFSGASSLQQTSAASALISSLVCLFL